jgi:hypothetical protein
MAERNPLEDLAAGLAKEGKKLEVEHRFVKPDAPPSLLDNLADREDFPAGVILGGYIDESAPTGLVRVRWQGMFKRGEGRWLCVFLDEHDMESHIVGAGDTPREAFGSLVDWWTILNGGVTSPTLGAMLPKMLAELEAMGL